MRQETRGKRQETDRGSEIVNKLETGDVKQTGTMRQSTGDMRQETEVVRHET